MKKEADRLRNQMFLELQDQVSRIIGHADTTKTSLSDWPNIQRHIVKFFPGVDVSTIPIYITSCGVMAENGLDECAGCYIDELKVILVKDHIVTNTPGKSVFSRKITELASSTMDPEDVVVHELMHAISHKIRGLAGARLRWYEGTGIKYRTAEEEFVYTNCMPYYRAKGMTDKQVIDSIFLPFCISDVMSDSSYLPGLFMEFDIDFERDDSQTQAYKTRINDLLNDNADILAPRIIEDARRRALKMIELYEKYGVQSPVMTTKSTSDPGDRIAQINMDDETW